jgi:hypothetical protein
MKNEINVPDTIPAKDYEALQRSAAKHGDNTVAEHVSSATLKGTHMGSANAPNN